VIHLPDRPVSAWRTVSPSTLLAWLGFYALFLLHAARSETGFLLLDHVNLVIHEGGHFFFSWFGETLQILGGTLAELLVPLLIAFYFVWHRQTAGVAFAAFWFSENFLYIATYMADARTQALPLVGSGEHDWELLFAQWGVLQHDQSIAGVVRTLGWVGMLASMGWLAWMALRTRAGASRAQPSTASPASVPKSAPPRPPAKL